MPRARILLLLLAAAILLAPRVAEAAKANWVVMIYMAADNNLEGYAYLDLEELEHVGSGNGVIFIVLVDRSDKPYENVLEEHGLGPQVFGDWSDARILLVEKHPEPGIGSKVLARLGEVNTGDPETLVRFVRFVAQRYPASHYALIMWNHGSGFNVAVDEASRDSLNGAELEKALREIEEAGIHIDLLGFDACLMATIETLYTVSGHVDYVVASPETEPGYGWPYASIAAALRGNPGMAPEALAKTIVRKYGEFYAEHGFEAVTLSAVKLAGLTRRDIATVMKLLASYAEANPGKVQEARRKVREYGVIEGVGGVTVDLLQLIDRIEEEGGQLPPQLVDAARKLRASVVARYAGKEIGDIGGLSIFYPPRIELVEKYRLLFPAGEELGWLRALRVLVNIAPDISDEPTAEAQLPVSGNGEGGVPGILSGAGRVELNGKRGDEILVVVAAFQDEETMVPEVYALTFQDGRLEKMFDIVLERPRKRGELIQPVLSVSGDYDGDGLEELIVANVVYSADSDTPRTDLVYLDFFLKPGGGLAAKIRRATINGYEVGGMEVGDVDGDGRPELVLAGTTYQVSEGTLRGIYAEVFIVDIGRFSPVANLPLKSRKAPVTTGNALALLDVDGDGDSEVFVSLGRYSEDLTPISDGPIVAVVDFSRSGVKILGIINYPASDLDSGDVDGDGKPELVLGSSNEPRVTVLKIRNGKVKQLADIDFSNTHYSLVTAVEVYDLDGDGVNELMIILANLDEEGDVDDAGLRVVSIEPRPRLEYSTDHMLGDSGFKIPLAVDANGDGALEVAFIEMDNAGVRVSLHNVSNYVVTNGSLRGRVVDEEGNPVPGAEIAARVPRQNTVYTTRTDNTGAFSFDSLPASSYELTVSVNGRIVAVASVVVKAGAETSLTMTASQDTASIVQLWSPAGGEGETTGSGTGNAAANTTTPTATAPGAGSSGGNTSNAGNANATASQNGSSTANPEANTTASPAGAGAGHQEETQAGTGNAGTGEAAGEANTTATKPENSGGQGGSGSTGSASNPAGTETHTGTATAVEPAKEPANTTTSGGASGKPPGSNVTVVVPLNLTSVTGETAAQKTAAKEHSTTKTAKTASHAASTRPAAANAWTATKTAKNGRSYPYYYALPVATAVAAILYMSRAAKRTPPPPPPLP